MALDRYEIGCSKCGVLCYDYRRQDALAKAANYQAVHNQTHEFVLVFDRMAHYGAVDTWKANGTATGRRARGEGR